MLCVVLHPDRMVWNPLITIMCTLTHPKRSQGRFFQMKNKESSFPGAFDKQWCRTLVLLAHLLKENGVQPLLKKQINLSDSQFSNVMIIQPLRDFNVNDEWHFAPMHMVFDIKADGCYKARLWVGGNLLNCNNYTTLLSKSKMFQFDC